ncbi:uncharacterized protein A1O9_05206 [Exophiala aquamarina CBS 119918]|uniref:RTA1 domain protein n=1 Tax=Exophiala aquamarina CBS 119918 TaxID=1182545 RepID=A0A072PB43_9EURO|nr:uncharacterized protein A1O9_05206 [Exophiala aquamarina CBS 119918]KEF57289.1 hypothetical protein A1O9_05206 [Exophiala aquamarina CBS 119918]
MPECVILPEPDRLWEFCPSYAAAITFLFLYSSTTLVHTVQAIWYRKPFAIALIMGGIWELVGFTLRVCSILNPSNGGYYSNMGILILLAPLWINAFVYMALGRLVHFTLVHDTVLRLRARHLTVMFVIFDITAFFMQAGGGIAAAKSSNPSTKRTCYNIYSAGVGVQMGFILWFVALVFRFHYKLRQPNIYELFDQRRAALKSVRHMIYALYAALVLILYRNSWRLAEYATGVDSPLRLNEWWFYVFDAVPMVAAMFLLNYYNPGRILKGPRADFSGEKKARRRAKNEGARKSIWLQSYSAERDPDYEGLPLSSRGH